jgi:NAD(P)-dependent dehydrogenase (short-subunit alcohol dehydrogenase family)
MAKHGVVGITRSAASELSPLGIRVNAVAPGNTVTDMTSAVVANDPEDYAATTQKLAETSPLGYAGQAEDIANAIVYLLSDESRYVAGHTLVVDAGQTSSGLEKPPFFEIEAATMLHRGGVRQAT